MSNTFLNQSYHFIRLSHRGTSDLRILLHFTKLLLLSQLILMLRGTAVEGQAGTPIPLVEDDVQRIVNAHNFFRSIVEPPASNMQRMRWNSVLATVAQGYAEMCMFDPNPNRRIQAAALSFNDTVGENRAFGRTMNYTELIERGWFVQRVNFNFMANMCLSLGACDEYMQLVWAESNLVGCGAANCPTVTGLPILPNAVVFVCNYAPEGNIPGERPYEAGEPCSNCPSNLPLCINNLCSSIEDMINNTVTTTTTPQTSMTSSTPVTSAAPQTTTTVSSTDAPMTTVFIGEDERGEETSRNRSRESRRSSRDDSSPRQSSRNDSSSRRSNSDDSSSRRSNSDDSSSRRSNSDDSSS